MQNPFAIRQPAPTVVGAGLVALDIVINGRSATPLGLWAGGTCGNVLTILAYLGWKSFPIARLKDDAFANDLISDVKRWKVNPRFLSKTESGSTPIIVERIGKAKDGKPHHRFEWNCPTCGATLPGYRPVLARDTEAISERLPSANAFFFDRVARSSVDLASSCRGKGMLVVFEPSSVKDDNLYEECVELADVVKYSHDHARRLPSIAANSDVFLEIETFGIDGLRYRHVCYGRKRSEWKEMGCYEVEDFKDAAGAGDWLTAGLIHQLGQSGRTGLKRSSKQRIQRALEFGQALAGINCQFEGARGSMYEMTNREFQKAVKKIMSDGYLSESFGPAESQDTNGRSMCPQCPVSV